MSCASAGRSYGWAGEVDRLDLAALIPGHALMLRGVVIVVGEDLEGFTMLGHDALTDAVDAPADLLSGHDL